VGGDGEVREGIEGLGEGEEEGEGEGAGTAEISCALDAAAVVGLLMVCLFCWSVAVVVGVVDGCCGATTVAKVAEVIFGDKVSCCCLWMILASRMLHFFEVLIRSISFCC